VQYTGLAPPLARFHPQRAGSADGVVQQLEAHHVPDGEIVERGAFLEVAPVEVDVATVRETDETVALPDHQLHDAAGGYGAAALRRPR